MRFAVSSSFFDRSVPCASASTDTMTNQETKINRHTSSTYIVTSCGNLRANGSDRWKSEETQPCCQWDTAYPEIVLRGRTKGKDGIGPTLNILNWSWEQIRR